MARDVRAVIFDFFNILFLIETLLSSGWSCGDRRKWLLVYEYQWFSRTGGYSWLHDTVSQHFLLGQPLSDDLIAYPKPNGNVSTSNFDRFQAMAPPLSVYLLTNSMASIYSIGYDVLLHHAFFQILMIIYQIDRSRRWNWCFRPANLWKKKRKKNELSVHEWCCSQAARLEADEMHKYRGIILERAPFAAEKRIQAKTPGSISPLRAYIKSVGWPTEYSIFILPLDLNKIYRLPALAPLANFKMKHVLSSQSRSSYSDPSQLQCQQILCLCPSQPQGRRCHETIRRRRRSALSTTLQRILPCWASQSVTKIG